MRISLATVPAVNSGMSSEWARMVASTQCWAASAEAPPSATPPVTSLPRNFRSVLAYIAASVGILSGAGIEDITIIRGTPAGYPFVEFTAVSILTVIIGPMPSAHPRAGVYDASPEAAAATWKNLFYSCDPSSSSR
jgi:hypothetical protein